MEICHFLYLLSIVVIKISYSAVIWRRKVEVSRHVGKCGVIGYILECLFCHGGHKNDRSIALIEIRDLQSCEKGKLKCRDVLCIQLSYERRRLCFLLLVDRYLLTFLRAQETIIEQFNTTSLFKKWIIPELSICTFVVGVSVILHKRYKPVCSVITLHNDTYIIYWNCLTFASFLTDPSLPQNLVVEAKGLFTTTKSAYDYIYN